MLMGWQNFLRHSGFIIFIINLSDDGGVLIDFYGPFFIVGKCFYLLSLLVEHVWSCMSDNFFLRMVFRILA